MEGTTIHTTGINGKAKIFYVTFVDFFIFFLKDSLNKIEETFKKFICIEHPIIYILYSFKYSKIDLGFASGYVCNHTLCREARQRNAYLYGSKYK